MAASMRHPVLPLEAWEDGPSRAVFKNGWYTLNVAGVAHERLPFYRSRSEPTRQEAVRSGEAPVQTTHADSLRQA